MAELDQDQTNLNKQVPQQGGGSMPIPKPPVPPPPPVPEIKPTPSAPKSKVIPTTSGTPFQKELEVSPPDIPRPKSDLGKKPKDVRLPEKGLPELSSGDQIAVAKEPILPPPVKKPPVTVAPTADAGPIKEKRDPRVIVKHIISVIVSLVVLVGIMVGYMALRNMLVKDDVVEEPDVVETTESVVVVEPIRDASGLKAINAAFDEIEDLVEVLEVGVDIENALNLNTSDF